MDPISCDLHDYLEIACLYRFEIRLALKQGPAIQGRAKTTETSADKKEYLVIETANGENRIEAGEIVSMTAITANPHFDVVHF